MRHEIRPFIGSNDYLLVPCASGAICLAFSRNLFTSTAANQVCQLKAVDSFTPHSHSVVLNLYRLKPLLQLSPMFQLRK